MEQAEGLIPGEAWPTWSGSNHDAGRFPTQWCDGDEPRIRAALLMLLTLRGTPVLYYGDEIGMSEVSVPRERIKDPVGIRGWPDDPGRDRARTPMPWTGEPSGGFTRPGVDPWLPSGDTSHNVADQRADPGSVLNLTKDLISLRRARTDLTVGGYAPIDTPEGVWAWRRGDRTIVALNHTGVSVEMPAGEGVVLLSTRRERDGERVADRIRLEPWEALVMSQQPVG